MESPANSDGFRRMWQMFKGGEGAADPHVFALLALGLLLLLAIPTLPSVFNRLVHGVTRPFRQASSGSLPTPRGVATREGLVLTSGCWFLLGASLWAALQAVGIGAVWNWESWSRYTAFLALAYVSGFIILFIPSGLGIREALRVMVLVPDIRERLGLGAENARPLVTLTVILLRAVWTTAELAAVAILYWLPSPAARDALDDDDPELREAAAEAFNNISRPNG